jgi:DNA-binding PadR family transcriptional regulator
MKKILLGMGLIKEIENKTGFWKPSPGSIYPLMEDLLEKN